MLKRFGKWLGNLLGIDLSGVGQSVVNKYTGSGLTGAEQEANQFNADEAEKQRVWQTQMDNTKVQRAVNDYTQAGVNPALMMSQGAPGSTPSGASAASVSPGAASMSDLAQLAMIGSQKKLVDAQARKTDQETEESAMRTENLRLVNSYYPDVTEAGLEKTLSEVGLNLSTIDNRDADTALKNVQKLIADKENEYSQQFFKARAELEEAKTEEAKQAAAAHAAQALMTGYEAQFAKEHGYKLSSSAAMAIVSAIGNITGLDNPAVKRGVQTVIKDSLDPVGYHTKGVKQVKEDWNNKVKPWWSNKAKPWLRNKRDRMNKWILDHEY